MAEAKQPLNVFVTGGAESIGLATVRALLQAGHKVVAAAPDAESALTVRMAGALPVYPDLGRASEMLSALQWAKADILVHAAPQNFGGLPHGSADYADCVDQLVANTAAVIKAAGQHGVKRVVSLSFAYLYESSQDASREGAHNIHDRAYAPMLAAEAALLESGLPGAVIRAGYIYGGNSLATAELAEAIKRSRPLPSGEQPASWIHEDDLAAAIVALIESENAFDGLVVNVADDTPMTPNEFAIALSGALGLNAPGFASNGWLSILRGETMRDKLLKRAVVIDSRMIREKLGWAPRFPSAAEGMEAAALVWRMKDAVNADDYYNDYQDEAAEAIAGFAYDVALLAPVMDAEEAAPAAEAVAEAPVPAEAAAPPPSDGPTPWNEDEAKREERRRKALERKAKRAAKSAGG